MRACVMVLVLVDVCMLQLLLSYFVIVFKQRTAYEKRMSDWRSDVCSSDLLVRGVDTVDIKTGVGFGKAKPLRLFQNLVKGMPLFLHGGKDVIAGAVQNAVDVADIVCSSAFAQTFYDWNPASLSRFIYQRRPLCFDHAGKTHPLRSKKS